jgi:hypothetical protein
MSVTLDLPEELEGELVSGAARLGLSLPEYLLRLISAARSAGGGPKNGTELVAYWQGEELSGARPDIGDSQAHARRVRERAERRGRV